MVKRGKNQKQKHWNSMNSKSKKNEDVDMNDMDDEIDAFHKQRDMIPLDVDADSGDSDEDDVQPVFEYKGIDGSDDEDEDEDDDDAKVNYRDKGLAAKIVRQQKYLREKTGGVDDDISDDDAEEDDNGTAWSRSKNIYYGEDKELSDEELAEEEKEVKILQQKRAESLRVSDFFNPDVSDGEPTLGEIKLKGRKKSSGDKEAEDDAVPMNVEVKKDLDAMSKDEQMDVVYRCAPELPGLLAELNDSYNKLETQVNPLLGKVKKGDNAKKEGKNYLDVKQVLLHAYSQAIVFYLLLRSEGQPGHDHPVIARIVEIKSLLDKMKELDEFIPDGLEDALNETSAAAAAVQRPAAKHPTASFNTSAELYKLIGGVTEKRAVSEFQEPTDGVKKQPTKINEKKRKLKDRPVSLDSVKMFEKRAELEANFKKKCASGFVAPRTDGSKKKIQKTITGKLETTDDFDDDAVQLGGATRDTGSLSSKLSRILPANKKKVISGDDDLPERDDLGERRWKHELRVLSSAGINTNSDDVELGNEPESLSPGEDDVEDNVEVDGSEDDFYEQCKRELDHKRRSKAAKYSRNPEENVLEAETTVDGKREFTSWMEKNRGLTRNRKKQNPRVVKRKKYEDAKKRRKGQVREIKKPTGGYGGETTGINTRVTKSIKFK